MAKLPELPKGREFEEYISAFFQCGGCYVERNIIEREERNEILELDLVATNYDEKQTKTLVAEVKSGDWGFSDIFKVKGWLDYLGFIDGLLITNRPKENIRFYEEKANSIGIRLVQIHDLSKTPEIFKEIVSNDKLIKEDFITWRFSYWVERNLLRELEKIYLRAQKELLG